MDPKLFTPGPLTTSSTVKEAMLRDWGSRESEFIDTIVRIRRGTLALAGESPESGYECVPVQGSGTFGIEALLSSAFRPGDRALVLVNGVYGARMNSILELHGVETTVLEEEEHRAFSPTAVEKALSADAGLTHVVIVHCETTTGVLNPVEEIGAVVRQANRRYLIDAMSSFGGIPLTFAASKADFIVSSSNKCIEGVPGFAFVLAERSALESCKGQAKTLALDLHAQWAALEKNGQFRFTPPTHAMLAFDRALVELEEEGGVAARNARYAGNQARLVEGMRALGFETIVPEAEQSPIITTFLEPDHPNYDFDQLHAALKRRGCAIYPGKLASGAAFRVGSVGQLFREDIETLLAAMKGSLTELGIEL